MPARLAMATGRPWAPAETAGKRRPSLLPHPLVLCRGCGFRAWDHNHRAAHTLFSLGRYCRPHTPPMNPIMHRCRHSTLRPERGCRSSAPDDYP